MAPRRQPRKPAAPDRRSPDRRSHPQPRSPSCNRRYPHAPGRGPRRIGHIHDFKTAAGIPQIYAGPRNIHAVSGGSGCLRCKQDRMRRVRSVENLQYPRSHDQDQIAGEPGRTYRAQHERRDHPGLGGLGDVDQQQPIVGAHQRELAADIDTASRTVIPPEITSGEAGLEGLLTSTIWSPPVPAAR